MRFVKMHGIGNDYVFVDCFHECLPEPPETLAPKVSAQHYGIGSDGLILILPSDICDARMRVFNADGSEAKMCGNGLRCVGRYLYDSGLCKKTHVTVETLAGVKSLELAIENGVAKRATADMGVPLVSPVVRAFAAGREWALSPVSMGNPHAVTFLPELPDDALFLAAGAALEVDPLFPDRANIEFCQIVSRDKIAMRVFERGSGETLACGTGACAALVAAVSLGLSDRVCTLSLPGGALTIEWRAQDGRVYMTGPMEISYVGEWRDKL